MQWRLANSLILATIIRTVLVIISCGCKVPAGIFVPSMAIGATFGRTVGICVRAMTFNFLLAPILSQASLRSATRMCRVSRLGRTPSLVLQLR